ncbi:NRDE family protein [Permianibacter fluminis]|uniref:NRDE family protein n=1 Tax=Permianibacter fluminis TaxID=2738515 RepID=UPI002E28B50B|nr:NRDE family protein [Permianibacter fluminis]
MCLIVLARDQHPDYPLIVLAHRDEFTARPSRPLHWWPDREILAGRDELAGGSWLGVNRHGRFAAVTNVREGLPEASARSRGELVTDWLDNPGLQAETHAARLAKAAQYSGFNLLFGGWQQGELALHYSSNRFAPRAVPAGIWALSNGDWNAPWPKARLAKTALAALLATSTAPDASWLDALLDRQPAADAELPDTGIGLERERWLSPLLITGAHYGTRATSLLSIRADGQLQLIERSLDPARDGAITGVVQESLMLV